jgi:hypothetical protein
MVNVGRRWAHHVCDNIRDGDHIVIFSDTTIIRELTANPARQYQGGIRKSGTYRHREPQPDRISVSDDPRQKCQR